MRMNKPALAKNFPMLILAAALGLLSVPVHAENAWCPATITADIGGTGSKLAQDGIIGTGAPLRLADGMGGTGAPLLADGMGGTGAPQRVSLAGRAMFVAGSVLAQRTDGSSRRLKKGDPVCEGDTLVAEADGNLQVAMRDEGLLTLRPVTRVIIETFRFNGVADGQEMFSLALQHGGIRTVTGEIGKVHKAAFRLHTPAADISVLGTDHETYHVPPLPVAGMPALDAGTYNFVISGATRISNAQGSVVLTPGETGFATDRVASPVKLNHLPGALSHLPVNRREARGHALEAALQGLMRESLGDRAETPMQSAPVGSVMVTALGDANRVGTQGTRADGDSAGIFGARNSAAVLDLKSGFSYLATNAPLYPSSGLVDGQLVHWGIYAGGTLRQSGQTQTTPQFVHYAFSPVGETANAILPSTSGVVTFSDLVGFTKPTTETGALGGNVSVSVGVNLVGTASVNSYDVKVTDAANRNWTGQFSGAVALSDFGRTGVPLQVNCTGNGCGSGAGTGSASGVIIGNTGKGMLTSFGLATSSLQSVSGAAVLSRP